MRSFNVAVIGAGGIARAHVAAASTSAGRIAVAAVVDPAEAARKGLADVSGGAPFESVEDALASPFAGAIDGLIVCTPPSVRIAIVAAALARGLPVLVEKPLAHRLADARQLAELAGKYPDVVSVVGYCHRFTPAIVEMKKRIDAGAIGRVSRFENTFAAPNPQMANHWMSDPAVSGGGSFIDTGCHSLDLFRFLIGPAEVTGAEFFRAWPGRGESSATVLLRSDDAHRVAGVIQSGWLEPARFIVTIVGTEGLLHYDYANPMELLLRRNEGEAQKIVVESHELRFERQLLAFAGAARGERSASLATFDAALRTAEQVDQAQRLALPPADR